MYRDDFEILKTKVFYKFSQNYQRLGVLLDYQDEKASAEDIENWPLVQSFALDGTCLNQPDIQYIYNQHFEIWMK